MKGLLSVKTNEGKEKLKLDELLNVKIKNIVIHCIPLIDSAILSSIRLIGKRLQTFIHPMLTPTFCHIAIQLNMENHDILIIEYGPYVTKESKIKKKSKIIEEYNDMLYYYINIDGARIYKIDKERFLKAKNKNAYTEIISKIIAANYYNKPYEEFEFSLSKKGLFNSFDTVECDVNNKMKLERLINNFRDKQWETEKYNILTHNCQTFGAKVITILEAIRINISDKIRTNEKMILPNCIISALWNNEKLSAINTIGRIPIIGTAFDMLANIFI